MQAYVSRRLERFISVPWPARARFATDIFALGAVLWFGGTPGETPTRPASGWGVSAQAFLADAGGLSLRDKDTAGNADF